jgi:hypothetical protein
MVFVVLYQNQVGRRTRRKKPKKEAWVSTCEKFENKTKK